MTDTVGQIPTRPIFGLDFKFRKEKNNNKRKHQFNEGSCLFLQNKRLHCHNDWAKIFITKCISRHKSVRRFYWQQRGELTMSLMHSADPLVSWAALSSLRFFGQSTSSWPVQISPKDVFTCGTFEQLLSIKVHSYCLSAYWPIGPLVLPLQHVADYI